MKALPLFIGILLVSTAAFARETAYKALRAFGTERGQALLSRVVEVQGRAGTPQPVTWKIILDDPNARGGVREVEIQDSQIVAEHTPLKIYGGVSTGAVMDFQKLSLDSEGAFKVANMEAKNAQFGFDSIDYTLRVADNSNLPVWNLHFLDDNQKSIGSIQIAADSGNVLARSFGKTTAPAPAPVRTAAPSQLPIIAPAPAQAAVAPAVAPVQGDDPQVAPPASQPPAAADANTQPDAGRPRIGHEIKKGFLNAGAAMEEFFTGKRTLDRKYREPEPATPYRGDD